MIATIITINQQDAKNMLLQNTKNRPVKKHHVAALCKEMREGRWVFNGDAIRISKSGRVIDGQHRLMAVVETGIPITTVFVSGLDDDVFDTIDTGAKRSAGDALAVLGEENAKRIAAAIVIVKEMLEGRAEFTHNLRPSNSEVVAFLNDHPKIRESVHWEHKIGRLAPPSMVISMHYLFSMRDKEKADAFFTLLTSGACSDIENPAFVLRGRLIANATAKAKLTRRYLAALFIKSWNYWIDNRSVRTLRFTESGDSPEQFPKIR